MNTSASIRRLTTLGGALAVAGALVSAQSQDSVELRVRDLYASAEYDQALSVIGNSQDPAAQQYRALCLLALGRQADAEAALERLIASAPEFTLSAEDMPPRFITMFAQQRREIVPGVLRKLFAEAREDYRAKAYDRALPQFKRVLALSSEAEVRDAEGVDDLRLLAESFIDIATASEAPKPEVVAAAAPVARPGGECACAPVHSAGGRQTGDATLACPASRCAPGCPAAYGSGSTAAARSTSAAMVRTIDAALRRARAGARRTSGSTSPRPRMECRSRRNRSSRSTSTPRGRPTSGPTSTAICRNVVSGFSRTRILRTNGRVETVLLLVVDRDAIDVHPLGILASRRDCQRLPIDRDDKSHGGQNFPPILLTNFVVVAFTRVRAAMSALGLPTTGYILPVIVRRVGVMEGGTGGRHRVDRDLDPCARWLVNERLRFLALGPADTSISQG